MIALRLDPRQASPAYGYRIAGVPLRADRELAWLQPFAATTGGEALPALPPPALGDAAGDGEAIFDGEAYLARRERRLVCRRQDGGFTFEVEALGFFRYREAAARIEVLAAAPEAPEELLAEVLLGPLLALALARRGIFLLHASGCEIAGVSCLFLGESGAGKSTLAARLSALGGGALLADDQAAIGALRLELLPDFPQPKLDSAAQVPLALAPARYLGGIFLLEPAPADSEPRIEEISPMVAAAGLLRHTTAARCFDAALLRDHLGFAAALVAAVPCRRLQYPHHPDAPKKIGTLLARG